MIAYAARRIPLLIVSLVLASMLVFGLLRLLPGDVATTMGGTQASPEQVAQLRDQLGLDRSLPAQYWSWVSGAVRGDLGRSPLDGTSVAQQLGEKLSVTGPLIVGSMLLAIILAVPLGVLAAVLQRSRLGTGIGMVSQLGIALPTLWVGLVLVVVFAVQLRWLPAQGFPDDGWGDPGAALRSLVLPAVTLALAEGAVLLRYVRSATLDVLHQDYIRSARARGRTRIGALVHHGLRNAASPVVSILGLQAAALLSGAVVVEHVFTLPGIGDMLIVDTGNRDLVKVQGELLLLTAAVLVAGFLIDLSHRALDPRLEATT